MNRKPNSAERVGRTLIMARRTLTEPKAAFAGVIPDISFARFRASMATLNAERILSLHSCRWDFEAIVETRSRRKETVRHRGCEGEAEPNLGMSGAIEYASCKHSHLRKRYLSRCLHGCIYRSLKFSVSPPTPTLPVIPTCLTTVKPKWTPNAFVVVPGLVNHAPGPFLECLHPRNGPRYVTESLARPAPSTRLQCPMPSSAVWGFFTVLQIAVVQTRCGEGSIGEDRQGFVGKTCVGPHSFGCGRISQ